MTEKDREKVYVKEWDKLDDPQKMKYLEVGKVVEKKIKKKKDDETFKPGIDK